MIAALKLRLAQAVWRFLPLPVALEDVEVVGPFPHGHTPITISKAGIKISGVRMTAIKRQHLWENDVRGDWFRVAALGAMERQKEKADQLREGEVWENDVWDDDGEGRG
jgi:hypothetical protein